MLSPTPLTAMPTPTIYLSDDEKHWIEKRQEVSDATSRSEVIRNALDHYRQIAPIEGETNG